ncbi:hypothetical protein SARC_12381 [Sphaeroforma arctica JP610]|uniref:Uncharacterized protein n=1 Tax=Sphaeroforma arctica JP610 TaxID=667725 RepID=A0A0L0FEA3_9EUKA|nr:hypothetical protein SARC_12381 [Sphaeroforma arctica JP610]KNC75087.1 hypothetical protein SARC_12381 [Sphaeroforma arctica JP610]|eukprot:XP_014148989.1 hypothetical protein SARC_12381 [Sphaeroforma arctica JP610]
MDDLASSYQSRMDRDECEIDARMTFANGAPTHIRVMGKGCVARLTTTATLSDLNMSLVGVVGRKVYGIETTFNVQLTNGTSTAILMN